MWEMSERMRAALTRSHRVHTTMPLVRAGVDLGVDLAPYLLGGQVTVQRAGVQRRIDVELGNFGGDLTIRGALSLLSPLASNDLAPRRGVGFGDGSPAETVPLGVFRVSRAEQATGGRIRLSGYDYGWVVSRNRFEEPYQIPSGTNFVTAITDLLLDRAPSFISPEFPSTDETTPTLTFDEQADPWEQAVAMAAAVGQILEFAQDGRLRMRPETVPGTSVEPAWSYLAGDAAGTLIEANQEFDAEGVYNVVIASGEPTDGAPPVRGIAEDLDPDSPTYVGGPYGRVTYFSTSPLLTSPTMAREAAATHLARELGWSSGVQITGVTNPALELGDLLAAQDPAAGLDGRFVAGGFTVPLRANQQQTVETTANIRVVVS